MFKPLLVTGPTETPVDLLDLALHLREDGEDQDLVIEQLLDAAVAHLDGDQGILGRALVTQTWRQDFRDWGGGCLRLPLFPVASITSVVYVDADDADQTVLAADYQLLADDAGYYVQFDEDYDFPNLTDEFGARVKVTYVAGQAVASVPAAIKQAIKLLVAHWYENREGVIIGTTSASVPMAVDMLVAPYRRVRL